jgi:DNA-binding NtrC family response regulator
VKNDVTNVLVVDDHVDFANSLAMQLRHTGLGARAVSTVRDALDALDEDSTNDLVITDIRMPEVDGLDLRRVLRHRFPELPVVLMTGLPIEEEDNVPGHVEVLEKPSAIRALLEVIARLPAMPAK